MDGKLIAKCTEEVILPPVQLTDNRYISWFVKNDINGGKLLYNYINAGYFPMGYMVHQLFLPTPGDEVVYCLLIRKSAFINKL